MSIRFENNHIKPGVTSILPEFNFMIETLLGRVAGGESLTADEMAEAMNAIMDGDWTDEQIAMLLTALAAKGESVAEVVGATRALRKHMNRIESDLDDVLDTCGTGGDHSQTFNISTAVALVVAASGVPVAKHGNRGVTSKSGSANVLAELGVNLDAPIDIAKACLEEIGLCFCFAPLWHPSMKRVSAVRQQLGIRTIFNLIGPLCNPANASYQLIGVGDANLRPLIADALEQLEIRRAFVVHGEDRLDEVTIACSTQVSMVSSEGVIETSWSPEDFGVSKKPLDEMRVEGPADSAAIIMRILKGERWPPREIVLMNAAAALMLSGRRETPEEAFEIAAMAVDDGRALGLLHELIDMTK